MKKNIHRYLFYIKNHIFTIFTIIYFLYIVIDCLLFVGHKTPAGVFEIVDFFSVCVFFIIALISGILTGFEIYKNRYQCIIVDDVHNPDLQYKEIVKDFDEEDKQRVGGL